MTDSRSASDDLAWIHAARLVADDLPAEEAARLRAWLQGSADGRRAMQDADAAWRTAGPLAEPPAMAWDTAAAMQRFRAARAETRAPGRDAPRWVRLAGVGAAAAAALVVLTVRGPWRARTEATPLASTVVVMANPAGAAPRTARLPDGSSVTLAPGSTLEGARGFGEAHRELRLAGEGAFTVAPGARPFRVRLQGTVVEDISTAFQLRPDGDGALVTVTEGAVVVGAWNDNQREVLRDTLRQGMAAQVGASGAVRGLGADVVARETAWTRGQLMFADAPLGEVAQRIARWSGRPVTVAPALAARRVTVTFAGEGVEEMAQVLAATVGARAEAVGTGWRVVTAAR